MRSILNHPFVISRINPTFHIDMAKVFRNERNKADSERYLEKLKMLEDPIIKSPQNTKSIIYEFFYERKKIMNKYYVNKYQKKIKVNWTEIKNKFFKK